MPVQVRSLLGAAASVVDAVSPSESASLKGHKAMTPIIAGSICGGLLFIAYMVGFTVYCMKRHRRRALSAKNAVQPHPAETRPGTFIIPPDPAVVLGLRQPGERVTLEDQRSCMSSNLSPNARPSPSKITTFTSSPPTPNSIAR